MADMSASLNVVRIGGVVLGGEEAFGDALADRGHALTGLAVRSIRGRPVGWHGGRFSDGLRRPRRSATGALFLRRVRGRLPRSRDRPGRCPGAGRDRRPSPRPASAPRATAVRAAVSRAGAGAVPVERLLLRPSPVGCLFDAADHRADGHGLAFCYPDGQPACGLSGHFGRRLFGLQLEQRLVALDDLCHSS